MDDGSEFDLVHQQYGHACRVGRLPEFYAHLYLLIAILSAWDRNAPDFASRASHPGAAVWPQLIGIPIGFSLVSFLGIIVGSSSQVIYGEAIWSPIVLLGKLLDGNPSGATRFGVVCYIR